MTARKPLSLNGKSPEELRRIIRNLENTCALQDNAIQRFQYEVAQIWLKSDKVDDQKKKVVAAWGTSVP